MVSKTKLSELTSEDIENIVRKNYTDIYKYCYSKTKDHHTAEDLTQETFLRFVEYIPQYTEKGKPKALLYTTARNLCINWYAKIKPVSMTDDIIEIIDNQIRAEEDDLVLRLSLGMYMEKLQSSERDILMFRYYQELSIGEISQILGINRFAVMYRLKKAKKLLHEKINQGGLSLE